MKKEEKIFIIKVGSYLLAGVAVVLALLFDKQIISWIFFNRIQALDPLFIVITYIGSLMGVVLVLMAIYLWTHRKRKLIIPLFAGTFIAFLITYILKIVIGRVRPYVALGFQPAVEHISAQSFPSMHSTLAFAVLPVLLMITKKKKYLWVILAVFVAMSRLFLGVHYLSDIIMGAMIGYFAMSLVLKEKKWFWRFNFK